MKTATGLTGRVDTTALEQKVKAMYRDVALAPQGEFHFEMGRALAERLGYAPADLDAIPSEAIDSFAGVGYYFDLARLKPGETVVDLGSGSGTDSFIAAGKVGKTGTVIGVDMTDEQLAKAGRLRELLVGHVDADHSASLADLAGGDEAVRPRPAAEIDHRLARSQVSEIKVVAHARKRVDGLARDGIEVGGRIAEPLRERTSHLEVELALRSEGHIAIHRLDLLLERGCVDAPCESCCSFHFRDLLCGLACLVTRPLHRG